MAAGSDGSSSGEGGDMVQSDPEFLEQLEDEFKNRYTDDDTEFMEVGTLCVGLVVVDR